MRRMTKLFGNLISFLMTVQILLPARLLGFTPTMVSASVFIIGVNLGFLIWFKDRVDKMGVKPSTIPRYPLFFVCLCTPIILSIILLFMPTIAGYLWIAALFVSILVGGLESWVVRRMAMYKSK